MNLVIFQIFPCFQFPNEASFDFWKAFQFQFVHCLVIMVGNIMQHIILRLNFFCSSYMLFNQFPAILTTKREQAHLLVPFSSFVDHLKWNGLIEIYKQKYDKILGQFRNPMNIINIKQQSFFFGDVLIYILEQNIILIYNIIQQRRALVRPDFLRQQSCVQRYF
ncbi:Hypothetical_protein [Hexamita inflata]|uniref:Hypothetical_protein n=1 Tax=Hexamita inflata TaxID=28002 RepID=A0ABP1HLM1_9EUKA